jgi:NAD(P)H-hydrate epimerase
VIATADGKVFVNPTGNPGMASGGMGDVLAGILVALLGQGFAPEDAMRLGVYLHGFAGDRAAEDKGPVGIIASDIVEGLPAGMAALASIDS